MNEYDEIELTTLLRALQPPPAHWMEAARRIPDIRRQLDQVLPLIQDQAIDRNAETEQLERAIESAGLDPEPELVAALRRHLNSIED